MTRKYSLAQLTTLESTPAEMVYMAARTGYDFVSIRPIYMGLPGEPNYAIGENKEMFRETKAALDETGIKIHDIELARIGDGLDPKNYVRAMEASAELGAKHVISSIWTEDRNFYLESFAELCELAKPLGLTINLEFVPIAGVRTLAGAVDVLNTVKKDNTGILVDIHHFHRAGDKVEDLAKLPSNWFNFIHLCDAPVQIPSDINEMTRILREARSYVGEGGIDIASIVKTLPEIPCSIELPNNQCVKDYGCEEHARRCLESAKEYFAANSLDLVHA